MTVWLTDVDADALDVARANLAGIGRRAANVRIAEGSWFDALPGRHRSSTSSSSNPPYVGRPSSPDVDAPVARLGAARTPLFAGADGLDAIRDVVAGAPRLAPARRLAGARDRRRPGRRRRARCSPAPGFVDVEIRPDLAGRDRVAVARRP